MRVWPANASRESIMTCFVHEKAAKETRFIIRGGSAISLLETRCFPSCRKGGLAFSGLKWVNNAKILRVKQYGFVTGSIP